MEGTMWKPSPSASSYSNTASGASGSTSIAPDAKLAVSITINATNPNQFCSTINDNTNGFDVADCHEYLITGWMNLCDSTLNQIEELTEVLFIKPTHQGHTASTTTSTLGSGFESSDPNRSTGSGTVKSQAIAAMQITKLLEHYPELTGEGLKIGIISDSYSNPCAFDPILITITVEDDILTSNSPSEQDGNKVIILNDNPIVGFDEECTIDEGRAIWHN
jgi:hypothetical protein